MSGTEGKTQAKDIQKKSFLFFVKVYLCAEIITIA